MMNSRFKNALGRSSELPVVALYATSIAALLSTAFSVILSWCLHINSIIAFDEWRIFSKYFAYPWWAVIWSKHNQYHLLSVHIVNLVDINLFKGSSTFGVLISWLLLLGTNSLFLLNGRNSEEGSNSRRDPVAIALFALGCSLFFWMGNYKVTLWSHHVSLTSSAFFSSLSLYCFVLYVTSSRSWLLSVAFLSALLATFAFPNGMFVWPTMIAVVALKRSKFRSLFGIGLLGTASILAYTPGIGQGLSSQSDMAIPRVVSVAFNVLGNAPSSMAKAIWGDSAPDGNLLSVAFCFGVLMALVVLACCISGVRSRLSQGEIFPLSILIYLFLTALSIGISRNVGQAPRYMIWSLMGLVALLWLGAAYSKRLFSATAVHRGVLVVSLALLGLIVASQGNYISLNARTYTQREKVKLSLIVGVEDPKLWKIYLFPRLDVIKEALPVLAKARISVFADPRLRQLGNPLRDVAEIGISEECEGRILGKVNMDDGGWEVRGWARDATGRPVRELVAVDSGGHVVGLLANIWAIPDRILVRDALEDKLGPVSNVDRQLAVALGLEPGWIGYINPAFFSNEVEKVTIYALLKGRREACAIGSM